MDRSRRLTLSVTEAAEVLGISRALAYELVARGELPSLQFGRRLVVPLRAIERLLASCEETEATEPPDGAGWQRLTIDQRIPTIDHTPQTTTEHDHRPTTRKTHAEAASKGSIPTATSDVPNPTHTGIRDAAQDETAHRARASSKVVITSSHRTA